MSARLAILLAGVLALALLAGCGGDDDAEPVSPDTPPPAEVDLLIKLDTGVENGPHDQEARVTCVSEAADPETTRGQDCIAADKITAEDFEPVPDGAACTEIYGGPDVVEISGGLRGERVEGTFTRENGCEIERFERIQPLVEAAFEGYVPGEAVAP